MGRTLPDELRWLDALQGSGIRPGLSRMRAMLRAADRPEKSVPAVLVAGTNGKGSTASTLASILTSAGCRTGLYTSPHLVRLEERWRIDGEPVTREHLREAVRQLRSVSDRAGIVPTYFEALTLLAFLLFRTLECDLSVLEVGMGGRLDATNVVRPLASIITMIDLDHCEFLGSTQAAIARERGESFIAVPPCSPAIRLPRSWRYWREERRSSDPRFTGWARR